jgi:hypothetical protein
VVQTCDNPTKLGPDYMEWGRGQRDAQISAALTVAATVKGHV